MLKKQFIILMMLCNAVLAQNLSGHGGAVRALSLESDTLLSGSFDNRAMVWDLKSNKALRILDAHEGAVSQVLLQDTKIYTGGEEGRVLLWQGDKPQELFKHEGGVVALAFSPKGEFLSASRDGVLRVGETLDNVKTSLLIGAGFVGEQAVSLTSEGLLTFHGLGGHSLKLNLFATSFLVAQQALFIGTAGGEVIRLSVKDESLSRVQVLETPVTAMALSKDNQLLAAASIASTVAMVDVKQNKRLFVLEGAGLPVWSLIFQGDTLLTGGGDKLIRRWNVKTGEAIGGMVTLQKDDNAGFNATLGEQTFRACAYCHALEAASPPRAGPHLQGLLGRKVGSVKGYNYSPALQQSGMVWNAETLDRLFDKGPQAMFPNTKMPEQLVRDEGARKALVEFLMR